MRFENDDHSRVDETDDRRFYARDRFVRHLDELALATVKEVVGRLIVEDAPAVLDLMASWDSHIPDSVIPSKVTGLGLNENELKGNSILTDYVIHDLNKDPRIPFPDESFDVVVNTVSVDYLTRPVEIFKEVRRLLKPGGLFLVTFSNRFFFTKAVKIWRESDDDGRLEYVKKLFELSGGFEERAVFVSKGRPRPETDRFAGLGVPSDPVYAVYANKEGRRVERPAVRPSKDEPVNEEELARRKAAVKRNLRCPYCEEKLTKYVVPEHPFTQWDNEYMYVCFNNACPYYTRSWDTMHRQGNPGMSYRLMYIPDRDRCMAAPVPSPGGVRESVRG